MKRHLIVVDVESSGLRSEDVPVEVAWHNLHTGDVGVFVPKHDRNWVLSFGEPKALEINGYRERLAGANQDDGREARELYELLDGHTLAGSNPTFDGGQLEHIFVEACGPSDIDPGVRRPASFKPWHHRMWDLSAYAAGVLQLDELVGLERVCELLSIKPGDHTAAGDVRATSACFLALFDMAGVKL